MKRSSIGSFSEDTSPAAPRQFLLDRIVEGVELLLDTLGGKPDPMQMGTELLHPCPPENIGVLPFEAQQLVGRVDDEGMTPREGEGNDTAHAGIRTSADSSFRRRRVFR